MHCFIGIDVQTPLANEIIGLQNRWGELGLPAADFHKHTDPHITLVPPFECQEPGALAEKLRDLASDFPAFGLLFLHVAAFNRRIIHISLESNAIVELRAQLLEACAEFTRIHDSNPFFHPHTTIGYTHRPLTTRQQTEAAAILERALTLPQRQEVTNFLLYGREKTGSNYRTLATLALKSFVDIEN